MPAPWEFSWDMRRPAGIGALFAALLLAFPAPAAISVTDGDTLRIDGRPHRIANIDAPELRHAQCDAERRLAIFAKRRLAELLASGLMEVTVGDPMTGRTFDRYDRILATISVDGRDAKLRRRKIDAGPKERKARPGRVARAGELALGAG